MDFVPLSAVTDKTCKQDYPSYRFPSVRFSQPLDRSDVYIDLRVYSTPQALPGSGLQSFPEKRSSIVIRLIDSYTVTCLSRLPFCRNLHSHLHHRRGFPFRRFSSDKPLTPIKKSGFRLRLGPILKFCSRFTGYPGRLAVSPAYRGYNSLGCSLTSRFHLDTLVSLPLLRFEPL